MINNNQRVDETYTLYVKNSLVPSSDVSYYTFTDKNAVSGHGLDENGYPVTTGGHKIYDTLNFVKDKCDSFENCSGFHYNKSDNYGQLKSDVINNNQRVDETYTLYVKNST